MALLPSSFGPLADAQWAIRGSHCRAGAGAMGRAQVAARSIFLIPCGPADADGEL
jgi:hypothetical protein